VEEEEEEEEDGEGDKTEETILDCGIRLPLPIGRQVQAGRDFGLNKKLNPDSKNRN
jgi:hypothetical protein